ncbi:MAG: phosphatidylserine decarboxylase [Chloroflexi bacterium]|nr:phosphatidylserine decarboxylase [Chloroflexota bacterium]
MRNFIPALHAFIAITIAFSFILPIPAAGIERSAYARNSHILNSIHQPVVQQLVVMVIAIPSFHAEFDAALLDQAPSSYWHGKTLDDMYTFLDDWLVFLPHIDDARLYMDRFYEFAGAGKGQELASKDPLRSWLYEYMIAVDGFMDSPASAAAVPWWTGDARINMTDYVVPPGGYRSFNEFFTRRIQPGARPIDSPGDPAVLTSPADSYPMKIADSLTSVTTIGVKGENLNIRELLGNDPLADDFINGKAIFCMLDTPDYHWYHAPVTGRIVSQHQLGGLYYGMDGGWVEYFFQHRRGYFIFDTEKFGRVAMVCVGMFTISSVNFVTHEGDLVNKGDVLGNFAYGGSAIILLFQPGRVSFSVPLEGRPVHVNMGQKIAMAVQPVRAAAVNTPLGTVAFTTDAGSIQDLKAVNPADVTCQLAGYNFPYGLFSYSIINLRPGQMVPVTISFPHDMPLNVRYVKCNNGILTDCSSFTNWRDGHTFVVNVTDGGPGDADGAVNGTISDPGGPAFLESAISTRPPSSSASASVAARPPQTPVALSNIYIQSASLSTTKAAPDAPVTVTADITNKGTVNGSKKITLYINGQIETTQGVTVNSGSNTPITFTVSRNEPGTYTVYVGGTNAGSFTVDQFADPNIILYISGALLIFAFVIGLLFILRRRQPGH